MVSDSESVEAHELKLYVDNDSTLYHQRTEPIIRNLTRKKQRGVYDRELAVKAFMYLADAGAKKYAREFGDARDWNRMFSVADRREAARNWVKEFETEYKLGAYDRHKTAAAGKSETPRKATTRKAAARKSVRTPARAKTTRR